MRGDLVYTNTQTLCGRSFVHPHCQSEKHPTVQMTGSVGEGQVIKKVSARVAINWNQNGQPIARMKAYVVDKIKGGGWMVRVSWGKLPHKRRRQSHPRTTTPTSLARPRLSEQLLAFHSVLRAVAWQSVEASCPPLGEGASAGRWRSEAAGWVSAAAAAAAAAAAQQQHVRLSLQTAGRSELARHPRLQRATQDLVRPVQLLRPGVTR